MFRKIFNFFCLIFGISAGERPEEARWREYREQQDKAGKQQAAQRAATEGREFTPRDQRP